MNLKIINNKLFVFAINLQIYLVLVNCESGLISNFFEDFISSHSFRTNFSGVLHNRHEHLEFLKDEAPILGRRLLAKSSVNSYLSTSTPASYYDDNQYYNDNNNNQYSTGLNRDPWNNNNNNKYTNRFDRVFNKIPSFLYSTFPTYSYNSLTTSRPFNKPSTNYKPSNYKPTNTAVSVIRPANVRPNYSSRPSINKYPKYNADCACKRKSSHYNPTATPSSNQIYSTTTLPSTTSNRTNRQPRSNFFLNDKDIYKEINTRIVNGTVADYYKYPWTVSLGRAINDKYTNESHYCGGTLISPSFVMSAAHCLTDFRPKKVIIGYGSGDRTKMKHFVEVEQWFTHPQYSGWPKYHNDIALVKLKRPIHLDGSIKPACLHSSYNIRLRNEYDAVGWGKLSNDDEFPVQLQKTKFEFVDTRECKNRWSKEDDHPDITIKNLCVFNKNTDICGGDSGSPAMNHAEDDIYYVVGVASFTNYCDQTQPAVYVRVYPYIDWIVSVVKNFC